MDSKRSLPPVELLTELLQGYRHPAAATTDQGAVVCRNTAAHNDAEADATDWPVLAVFQTPDGQSFLLRSPARTRSATSVLPTQALPPRLAKVAGLVIDGLTDKRIAQRLGLTFSTVRTYVRQIYRRVGVHSRVGLVHAARGEATTDGGETAKVGAQARIAR
jgi:DNA-binding CsgD family transcriptional regulator